MSPVEHVWDALNRQVRQRVPVPANIQQLHSAMEEEWDNIPQSTINSLINPMWRRRVALHEANGHTRYWLVFWSTPLPFFKGYLWPTDAYVYSQSCDIHRLGPDEFDSIDWFPHMNCNSVKSLEALYVAFILLFSIDYRLIPDGSTQLFREIWCEFGQLRKSWK